MIQRVEVFGQVEHNGSCISLFRILLNLSNGILGPSVRTVAVASFRKEWFVDGHKLLGYSLLNSTVYDGGNTKLSYSAVRLRDFLSSHRRWGVMPLSDFLLQLLVVFP